MSRGSGKNIFGGVVLGLEGKKYESFFTAMIKGVKDKKNKVIPPTT
jgi:hypothetical protein